MYLTVSCPRLVLNFCVCNVYLLSCFKLVKFDVQDKKSEKITGRCLLLDDTLMVMHYNNKCQIVLKFLTI